MKHKVSVVIVTYGNRYCFLEQVIDMLLSLKINKIVVVNNNSSNESYNCLIKLENKLAKKLRVIHLSENTGSANGFKTGINYAVNMKASDFIWLLDDDNRPKEDALDILMEYWERLTDENKNNKICLLSYRKGHTNINAIMNNNPGADLGRNNTFRAFHISSVFKNLFLKKKGIYNEKLNHKNSAITFVAPYGGMFFHKRLVDLIGLPDASYYLYSDDHEYSYRITKKGGSIIYLPASQIDDIDFSWHSKSKQVAVVRFAKSNDFVRLFYSIRNRVFFEKNELVTNWCVYIINMLIYSIAVFFISLVNFRLKNMKIYFKAVYFGLTGKMGVIEDIKFK